MAEDLGRKNELEILGLRGELKLLNQKLDTIKNNVVGFLCGAHLLGFRDNDVRFSINDHGIPYSPID